MSYGTSLGVAARVPGLTLDLVSTPTFEQVDAWLRQGSATIDRVLGAAGWLAPVAAGTGVHEEATALAEQYAAAHALRARGIDSLTGESETRSDVWLEEFRAGLLALASADLSGAGGVLVVQLASRPRRLRTVQVRRIDGYSALYEGVRTPYLYPSE